MRISLLSWTAIVTLAAPPLQAAPKPGDPPKKNASNNGQHQGKPETPRSQGHLQASVQAILNVCSKDNPAATRSALCTPKPVSPQ